MTRGRGRRARYTEALCQVLGTAGHRGHKAVRLSSGRVWEHSVLPRLNTWEQLMPGQDHQLRVAGHGTGLAVSAT